MLKIFQLLSSADSFSSLKSKPESELVQTIKDPLTQTASEEQQKRDALSLEAKRKLERIQLRRDEA